jgi:NADH-quinone oxidoreductase subunit G
VGAGSDFGKMGKDSTIVVIGGDVEEEAPIWFLRIRGAVKRGVQLIVAHSTGQKLERYTSDVLRYKPGMEAHIALGLLNVVLSEGAVGDLRLTGEFLGKAGEYAPEKVEQMTGVPAQAIKDAAKIIAEASDVVFIFGQSPLDLIQPGGVMKPEASALAQACANIAVVTGHSGKPNNGLLPLWPHNNTQGTHDLIGDLKFGLGPVDVLFVVGTDPIGEGHGLPRSSFVVAQELFLTATAKQADVILPALSFAERDGSYTSADRRAQRFYRALPPLGDGKADWEIAQDIARRLGLKWDYQTAEEIFVEIAAKHPRYAGLTYAVLAQTEAQWPPVGDNDLYFGGTAYDNRGGLGAQMKSDVEIDGKAPVKWVDSPDVPADFVPPPSRRLYDRGTLIDKSKPFHPRLLDRAEALPLEMMPVGQGA